eukprot:276114_1
MGAFDWCPKSFLFDYKRFFMQLCLAILYTIISILDFIHHNPIAPAKIYWFEVSIIIIQYICYVNLGRTSNFDWQILQGMIRQFDILILSFCILFIFSLDANQLKFLSMFWIIGLDCIRCKDKLFVCYVILLAVIDSIFELFQQLIHDGQITNYLIDSNGKLVHLHSLEVACIFAVIIRLCLPLYKLLKPSNRHYSMHKKLLFVRKNRYRRDLLRYAVSLHRKSKVDTLVIKQTFGDHSFDSLELLQNDRNNQHEIHSNDNDHRFNPKPQMVTVNSLDEFSPTRGIKMNILNAENDLKINKVSYGRSAPATHLNTENINKHQRQRFSTTDDLPRASMYYKKKNTYGYVPPNQALPLAKPKPLGMSVDEWIRT